MDNYYYYDTFNNFNINNLLEEDKKRIKFLKIPPNWIKVKINKDSTAKIQVTGIDSKGRTQYIYHPAWVQFSKETKYSKINSINFNKFENLIKKMSIFNGNITKDYIISNMLIIMKDLNIRVGNEKYLEENESVGLCTLTKNHYKKTIGTCKLIFKGKRGVIHEKILNKQHITFIDKLKNIPGKSLFKYIYKKEECVYKKVTPDDINLFLKEHVDKNMTCKDIRTYCANKIFKKEYNKFLKNGFNKNKARIEAIKITANELGNTTKVCRDSYIDPCLYA